MNTTIVTKIHIDGEGFATTKFFSKFGKLDPKKMDLNAIDISDIIGREIINGGEYSFSDEETQKILNAEKKYKIQREARIAEKNRKAEAAYNFHRWGGESFE